MNHAVGPKKQANCGASFRIAFQVRQVVVLRKSLILGRRAQASGQVEFAPAEILPKIFADSSELIVFQFVSKICSRAVEVHCAHGVADNFMLLAKRLVRLHIGVR